MRESRLLHRLQVETAVGLEIEERTLFEEAQDSSFGTYGQDPAWVPSFSFGRVAGHVLKSEAPTAEIRCPGGPDET